MGIRNKQKLFSVNSFREKPEKTSRSVEKEKKKKFGLGDFLEWMIVVSMVALFFGFPLFFTGLTFQGIAFEKQIYFYFWILLALIAWMVKSALSGKLEIRKTPLDIPILIFLLFYVLSTIFSVDKWHSFWGFFGDPSRGLINVLAIVIAYYILFSNFDRKKSVWAIGALIVSGALMSVWLIMILLGINVLPDNVAKYVPASPMGSMPEAVAFCGLILPVLVALAMRVCKKNTLRFKVLLAFLLLNILAYMFILYLLSAFVFWAGLFAGMGIFLVFTISKVVDVGKSCLVFPAIIFLIVVAVMLSGGSMKNSLVKAQLPSEIVPENNLSYAVAKESLKNDFFLGSGPATYGHAFSLYKPDSFNVKNKLYGLRLYQAGNAPYELVSTIGGVGTVLWILLLLSYVGLFIYYLSKNKAGDRILSLGMFCSAIVFIFNSFVTSIEGPVLVLGCLLTIVGLVVLLEESETEKEFLRLSLEASPKYALALSFLSVMVSVGAVFLFVTLGKIFVADLKAGFSIRQEKISEQGSLASVQEAVQLNPREGRYVTRIGQELMTLANMEVLKSEEEKDAPKIASLIRASIASATKGMEMMPKDVLATEVLAGVYENSALYVTGSLEKSMEFYEKASALEPGNPDFYLKIGQVNLSLSQKEKDETKKKDILEKARENFMISTEKKKDYSQGYYYLALTDEALKNSDSAIDNMTKAFQLGKSDNSIAYTYAFNLGRLFQERGAQKKTDGDGSYSKDFEVAQVLFKDILKKNPDDISTNLSLAVLNESLSKKDEAISGYNKVLELLPDNDEENIAKVKSMIEKAKTGNVVAENEVESQSPTLEGEAGETKTESAEVNQDSARANQGSLPEVQKRDEEKDEEQGE